MSPHLHRWLLRRTAFRLALAVALGVALTGCSGGSSDSTAPTPPANTDVADVSAGLATSPSLLGDDLFDVTLPTGASARAAGAMAALDPLSFYRWVRNSSRSFTSTFSDSDRSARPRAADVLVSRDITGMLHIIRRPAEGAPADTHNVIHKVIRDLWTRRLHLLRETVDTPQGPKSVWRVTQASGIRIASVPSTRIIQSVHLTGSGLDVRVTDPAQLMTLAQVPQAATSDSVTVTVDAGPATGNDVFLYWHDHRARMHPNGDGTHTLRIFTDDSAGLRGIGVNVLSFATLHDDISNYDSLGWIVPLRIGGAPVSVWP